MIHSEPTEIDLPEPPPAPPRGNFPWEYIVGVLAAVFWFYLAWSGAKLSKPQRRKCAS